MVEAVNNNNNRNTAYTLGGVGVGALAGAGYSHFVKKPLLNGEGPSDAFIKQVYENKSKQTLADAESAAKQGMEAFKDSDLGALKAELNANPSKYGIQEIVADTDKNIEAKSVADQITEYTKDADANALRTKMEKSAVDTATAAAQKGIKDAKKIQSAITEAGKLTDETADDALKTFAKNNKEAFGFADDAAAEAHIGTLTGTQKDKVKALKDQAEALFADAKKAITDNWDSDKKGLKALAEGASEEDKNLMKLLKSAAHHVQGWSAAKWAGIGAAALGIASYIGAKMSQPKAEPQEEAAALQAHQA